MAAPTLHPSITRVDCPNFFQPDPDPTSYSFADYTAAPFPKHGILSHAGWMLYTPAMTLMFGLTFRYLESSIRRHPTYRALSPSKLHSAALHLSNIIFYTLALAVHTYTLWPDFFPYYFTQGESYFVFRNPGKAWGLMFGGATYMATLLWDVSARQGIDASMVIHHIGSMAVISMIAETGWGLEYGVAAGYVTFIEQPIDLAFLLYALRHPLTLPIMQFATPYFVMIKLLGGFMLAVILYRQWTAMPVVARVLYLAVLAGTAAAQVHTAVVLAGMCKRIEERGISGMTSEKSLARIPEEDVLMPMSVTGSLTPAPGHANGGAHKQILLPSRIVVKAKPHRRAVLIDTSSSSMLLYDQDSPTTAVSESTAIFFEAKKVE